LRRVAVRDDLEALDQQVVADRANGYYAILVLPDGDVYVLKSVVHNWDDEAAERVLQSCRRAMGPHARLLIAERVVPVDNAPSEAKLFDINMLVIVGGRERTEAEYRGLLESQRLESGRPEPASSTAQKMAAPFSGRATRRSRLGLSIQSSDPANI
jgi:hypothetical protein